MPAVVLNVGIQHKPKTQTITEFRKRRSKSHKEWRAKDRKKRPYLYKAAHAKWVAKEKAWYSALMDTQVCVKCNNPDRRVLEWAHLPNFKKLNNVAHMVGRDGHQTLLDEMAKCVVMCANCHKIMDYKGEN